jgi:hypothetical protein
MIRNIRVGHKNNIVACAFIPALVIAVLTGTGGTSESTSSKYRKEGFSPRHAAVKNHARPVQWVVWRRAGENNFTIGNNLPWCPNAQGTNGPRIRVRQIDRPKRVTLIAYLVSGKASGCLAVEAQVERVVHIRGGLRGRKLVDGSKSPPVQRWPRPAG